jgi:hypothetical protein
MPDATTYLNQTYVFEWHVVWCGLKNENLAYMHLREIGIGAQDMFNHSRLNSPHN